MYPKIKIQLHQELDIQIGSRWPDARVQYKELNTTNVQEFVQSYYRKNEKKMNNIIKMMAIDWGLVEKDFYEKTDKVFENYHWPEGLYICYLSIFNCNPRFLENKTFQAYYLNKVGIEAIIAHEILHFIFYDYFEIKETEFFNKIGKDEVWRLSESFDVLALENQIFEKFRPKISGGYPEIIDLNDKLRDKLLGKNFTIANFIKAAKLASQEDLLRG